MADTFSQIYIHIVMVVKHRTSLIHASWEERLHKYITGIVSGKGQKLLAINGMPDHIHIFIGMKPSCCLSDLVREIKKASTAYIKDNKLSKYQFNWQEGFGAFSYSHSHIDRVVKYILNQKEHHSKQKFRDEYRILLQAYEVEYEEKYLFNWIDDV